VTIENIKIACAENRNAPSHRFKRVVRHVSQDLPGRVLAAAILAAMGPLILLALLFGARIEKTQRMGRHGREIWDVTLARNGRPIPWASWLPRLFQIMRGELAWVGPNARPAGELDLRREPERRVVSVRPGLISTWWIRRRTNIAFAGQIETDAEYINDRSLKSDIGILVRSMLVFAYGGAAKETANRTEFLGVPTDNITMEEAIEAVMQPTPAARQVSFVNVDCVNKACRDQEYRDVLLTSDLRLADGIGLRIAGKILGNEVRENVNGTDMFPRLCARLQDEKESLFLLGGRPGIADGVARWAKERYPELAIAGIRDGFFGAGEERSVVDEINRSGATILLVAFGAPKQELWIRKQLKDLKVRSALGVGGLFDFYSGMMPRAPQWVRELGMEWAYRLAKEPGRMWKRYLLGNGIFLFMVMLSKFRGPGMNYSRVGEAKPL
jgi:N-acetylglucosaminyldiphosphoundecaprenol N-acetyl-beta-D-mannosaminyltransferase